MNATKDLSNIQAAETRFTMRDMIRNKYARTELNVYVLNGRKMSARKIGNCMMEYRKLARKILSYNPRAR